MSSPSFPSLPLERRAGYDAWLLAVTLGLCLCGAMFVLTSSAIHSGRLFHGDSMAIFRSHLVRLAWGGACLVFMWWANYHYLARLARLIWAIALLALIVVLFLPQPPGATAHRWIYLGGFSFQPAELAKFALMVYLAMRFSALHDDPFTYNRRKLYRGALAVTLITFGLVLIEPNLSMAALVLGISSVLFLLSGVRVKPLMILAGALAVPVAFVAWLTPYMHSRLTAFVSGITEPVRAGYHVKQSLIGIGHGGLLGIGLGNSTQKHFFLPEPYKDFIFSIVAEEAGFVGALLLLAGFVLLLTRAWRTARHAPDSFGYFLGAGITFSIALSLMVNVGVTLGLLPATGQPLPFVSYGGSSLMMTLGAVGVLLNISRQSERTRDVGDLPYTMT
jgi:cell division protein FtsW